MADIDAPLAWRMMQDGYLMQINQLRDENGRLRELAAKMAKALRVGSEWCDRECIVVFGCDGMDECPIAKELRELGIEVPDGEA